MASRWFIINEWLFSNLSGEKDSDKEDPEFLKQRKEESVRFLELFFIRKDDGIVVLPDSPWITKLRRWADRANKTSVEDRELSKRFFREVLLQPSKGNYLKRMILRTCHPYCVAW